MANRFELGHMAWPILTQAARKRQILTYLDLATALGYRGAKVTRFALWTIQDFCLEKNLPPLTSLVVNKGTKVPGSGFIAWEGDIGDAQARVFDFDWSLVATPFPAGTSLTRNDAEVGGRPSKNESFEVADSETIVNGRGPYQAKFRSHLMRSYASQCAMCDTRHPAMLVASHIIPWSLDSKNRLNPRNGILLCRTHDAAFESGILQVRPDCTVEVTISDEDKLGHDLTLFLREHTATRLRDPHGSEDPNPKFLAWRLNRTST